MAAEAGGDGNGGGEKSTTFRWLDVVRYAVAAVVTVVVAAVVVEAVKVVFRSDSLIVSVIGNSVNITRLPPPGEAINFDFTLQTTNPSGRVGMYYTNIATYLFDNGTDASTAKPEDDCIIQLDLPGVAVAQLQSMNSIVAGYGNKTSGAILPHFFDILYKTGGELSDATIRVDGYLVTELLRNSTPAFTTYYCKQILVAVIPPGDDTASENTVACTTSL